MSQKEMGAIRGYEEKLVFCGTNTVSTRQTESRIYKLILIRKNGKRYTTLYHLFFYAIDTIMFAIHRITFVT